MSTAKPPRAAAPPGEGTDDPFVPWFTLADVARFWTDERRKALGPGEGEISTETVRSYCKESAEYVGNRPGRYADHPVPHFQRRGQRLVWIPGPGLSLNRIERDLRKWWNDRPGRGVGGGRRPTPVRIAASLGHDPVFTGRAHVQEWTCSRCQMKVRRVEGEISGDASTQQCPVATDRDHR